MKYISNTCSVELSVGELCSRAYLGGDIDSRFFTSSASAGAGADIHRRLQREGGLFYSAEVSLSNTCVYGGIYYTVSGRADGVIRKDGGYTVDEIKTVRPFDFMLPPREIFLAQMKCYAYFLVCREELASVRGRITYVNSENEKIKYYDYEYTADELRAWYMGLIAKISRTASFMKHRTEEALPSAENAVFPYGELREGQEIMIRECYSAIKNGKRLFVQAPTGTGKTISSMYPAARALGAGYADKIFYLTAKSSTRREAYSAAKKMFEAGARLRTVVITAKEQTCLCSARGMGKKGNLCNPADCEFAAGYYDRSENAVFELLSRGNGFTRQMIKETALKHRVCPYELSLDLSEYCDIVICDYNYVFDPTVYFRRYFSDTSEGGKYVFLLDEAHNLADRARDMYSAVLKSSFFERLYARIDASDGEIDESFEKMIRAFRALRKLCRGDIVKTADGEERGFYINSSLPMNFQSELEIFKRKADAYIKKNADSPLKASLEELISEVRRYLTISDFFDERFLFYTEISGGDIAVKIYCLDPSHIMDVIQNRAVAAVFFSATLTPSDYFTDVLGGGKDSVYVSLPSPFDSDKLCVAVVPYLSTRYEDRKKNASRYVSVIAASVVSKPGNYIVYFPSYEVMENVAAAFSKKYPDVKTIVQKRDMPQSEREEFLDSFKEDEGKLRIGFCVLGGSFAEGVDLPGSRLIGTVIFGVGLPGLSNENNIIRDYFELKNGCGYDYAYTFNGMNRVLQAAGRVIRSDEDKGVVVLVDDRYDTEKYREMFPEHWKKVRYAGNAASLAEIVRDFWNKS
ncbi:MAG: DEAD/DEAH box helicase family protein [Clostridia bacterium]|nr:DEAD/DEAH box helicase family protein [Clostridia bacterium]